MEHWPRHRGARLFTGWGRRVANFLATKILRDKGAGPALLIRPLISLMRNQMLAAERLGNQLKALVATVALGMGFDKPDLGFVIHFQGPGSVVAYYQQVGAAYRAGVSAARRASSRWGK